MKYFMKVLFMPVWLVLVVYSFFRLGWVIASSEFECDVEFAEDELLNLVFGYWFN